MSSMPTTPEAAPEGRPLPPEVDDRSLNRFLITRRLWFVGFIGLVPLPGVTAHRWLMLLFLAPIVSDLVDAWRAFAGVPVHRGWRMRTTELSLSCFR